MTGHTRRGAAPARPATTARGAAGLLIALLLAAVIAPLSGPTRTVEARTLRDLEAQVAAAPTISQQIAALVRLAEANRVLGNARAAQGRFEMAVDLAARDGTPAEWAYANAALGVWQAAEGLSAAKGTLENIVLGLARASSVQRAPLDSAAQVIALSHLARLKAERPERLPEALENARRAAAYSAQVPDATPLLAAFARIVAGEMALASGLSGEGLGHLRAAAAELADAPRDGPWSATQIELANVALEAAGRAGAPADRDALHAIARPALEAARQTPDDRLRSEALSALALYADQTGRSDVALARSAAAMELAQSVGLARQLFHISRRRGDIAVAAGRPDIARAAYRNAFDNLRAFRADMIFDFDPVSGRSTYRREADVFHRQYIDFLLRADRPQDYFDVIDVYEDLRLIRIEELLQADCVRRGLSSARLVGGERFLGLDAAIVYPIVLGGAIDRLFLVRGDGGDVISVAAGPLAGRALDDIVAGARAEAEDESATSTGDLQALYDLVLRPLEPHLAGVQTLIYIPDGPLRSVPLAALHDGRRFVIEGYATSMLLGITFTAPEDTFDPGDSLALVAGATTFDDAVRGQFLAAGGDPARRQLVLSDLASVRGLTASIASTFRRHGAGADERLDDAFGTAMLGGVLRQRPYNVIHISTHAEFTDGAGGRDGRIGTIWLKDGPLPVSRAGGVGGAGDLVSALQARGNAHARQVDLLVFGACETARGREEAPLGIAGAAYRANVASIVATLWSVRESSASAILESFYRHLLVDRLGRAEALRAAQIDYRAANPGAPAAKWAAFVLIGDWR